jgi:hypothetical protein
VGGQPLAEVFAGVLDGLLARLHAGGERFGADVGGDTADR